MCYGHAVGEVRKLPGSRNMPIGVVRYCKSQNPITRRTTAWGGFLSCWLTPGQSGTLKLSSACSSSAKLGSIQ